MALCYLSDAITNKKEILAANPERECRCMTWLSATGTVVDGTGAARRQVDVVIDEGLISEIRRLPPLFLGILGRTPCKAGRPRGRFDAVTGARKTSGFRAGRKCPVISSDLV
jgi:hypothetical protein